MWKHFSPHFRPRCECESGKWMRKSLRQQRKSSRTQFWVSLSPTTLALQPKSWRILCKLPDGKRSPRGLPVRTTLSGEWKTLSRRTCEHRPEISLSRITGAWETPAGKCISGKRKRFRWVSATVSQIFLFLKIKFFMLSLRIFSGNPLNPNKVKSKLWSLNIFYCKFSRISFCFSYKLRFTFNN